MSVPEQKMPEIIQAGEYDHYGQEPIITRVVLEGQVALQLDHRTVNRSVTVLQSGMY